MAKPVYETTASVVLYRDRIENPNAVSEEGKNRWVWVRDGLTLTEGLMSDETLEALVAKQPKLQDRYDNFKAHQLKRHVLRHSDDEMPVFLNRLRNQIKIEYTGGDSNTFIFTVNDRSPEISQYIAQAIIERLRKLWVIDLDDAYASALSAISQEINKAGPEATSLASRSYLRNTYNGLLVESRLSAVMAEKTFQIVRRPAFPVSPVWPRSNLLLTLGAGVGLLVGFFLMLLRDSTKDRRKRGRG